MLGMNSEGGRGNNPPLYLQLPGSPLRRSCSYSELFRPSQDPLADTLGPETSAPCCLECVTKPPIGRHTQQR